MQRINFRKIADELKLSHMTLYRVINNAGGGEGFDPCKSDRNAEPAWVLYGGSEEETDDRL